MAEMETVATVQQVYGAFGRGDIASVIQMTATDVEWVVPGPAEIPWYGSRRGKEGVGEFFASMAQHTDIRVFEPREILAHGETVVGVLHIEYALQHNACIVSQDQVHLWTIRAGKVTRFQDFQETAGVAAAWRGA